MGFHPRVSALPSPHADFEPGTPSADPMPSDHDVGTAPGARTGTPPGDAETPEPPLDRLTVRPPRWLDRALDAAIVTAKAATIACAIDGFVNADSPRLRGKGIRARA